MSAREDDPWRELHQVADSLTKVSVHVARELVTMPNAADLTSRMFQVVGSLTSLMVDAREAAAQREANELRELVKIKSDFLRLTTHELRRPLGLLSGYLSLIQEGAYGEIPDKMRPGLQMAEAGTAEMAMLVEGLASIARLEDRAGALRRQPTRLGHLVNDAVVAVMPEATAKTITIEQQLPEPDILASVDRQLLRVAVVNLLGNAVKYAPGQSTVRVVVKTAEADLTVAVSDEGPGIDLAEIEHIFEPWRRASKAQGSGMGLGLYIVRQIVDLHGGRVLLDSTPGQGSTFTVVLP